MNHDHDDGLVHSHTWASEPPRPGRVPVRLTQPKPVEPDHDEGLVHSHGWACGQRGQMVRPG